MNDNSKVSPKAMALEYMQTIKAQFGADLGREPGNQTLKIAVAQIDEVIDWIRRAEAP